MQSHQVSLDYCTCLRLLGQPIIIRKCSSQTAEFQTCAWVGPTFLSPGQRSDFRKLISLGAMGPWASSRPRRLICSCVGQPWAALFGLLWLVSDKWRTSELQLASAASEKVCSLQAASIPNMHAFLRVCVCVGAQRAPESETVAVCVYSMCALTFLGYPLPTLVSKPAG